MANDIASLQAAGQPAPTRTTASSTLGGISGQRDQFLKLLLAQLKNQDPLQAPDASKFTEQMTQFGQLEQLFDVNESLQKMSTSQGHDDRAQAIGMIGKQIQAPGDSFALAAGGKATLGYTLDRSADSVGMKILDSNGTVVRQLDLGRQGIGTHATEFDGKDSDGAPLPAGNYSVRLAAVDNTGAAIGTQSIVQGIVSGVLFDPAGPLVQVGNSKIKLGDVMSVQGV